MKIERRARTALVWFGRILCVVGLAIVVVSFPIDDMEALFERGLALVILAATLCATLAVLALSMGWTRALPPPAQGEHAQAIRAYCTANLAKYAPGNVMHYVARQAVFAAATQKRVALASATEIAEQAMAATLALAVLQLACAATGGDPVLAAWLAETGVERFWTAGMGAAAVIVTVAVAASPFSQARTFLWRLAAALLLEAAAYAVTTQVVGSGTAANVAGMFSLAWLAGFVVPGAPGGLGVREVAFVALVAPAIDAPTAALVAVALRIATIAGDLAAWTAATVASWTVRASGKGSFK